MGLCKENSLQIDGIIEDFWMNMDETDNCVIFWHGISTEILIVGFLVNDDYYNNKIFKSNRRSE